MVDSGSTSATTAQNGTLDAVLRVVISAWEHLDDEDRKTILTVVRRATQRLDR
jgi:hypothetical protein